MTSNENNEDTINFLEKHNYFGYPKDYVYIFEQGKLPLINEQGKLLIGSNGLIKEASNGNGGIFNSMLKKGVIADMDKRGIEWVFIGSVDNILLKYVDVLLLGLTASKGNQIGTRTVLKRSPDEKVGVLCKQNNKVKVIEYTEIPDDIAGITDENGELTGEIKDRRYEVFSTAQRQAYTVVLPADTPEKDFAIRQKVKLINPVVTNYAIPNNNFLPRVGIRITADDLVEDKGIDKITKPSNPTETKK